MFEEADLGTADTADTPQSDEDMEALMVAIENDNNNGIAVQAMPDAETLLMLEEDVGSDVDTEADTEVDTEAVSEDIGPQEDTERTEGATPETVTLEPHESPMPSAAVPCADGPAPIEAPPAEEEHHPIEAVPVLDDVPPEAVMADKDGLIGGDVLDD